jgi:predicted ATPase/DNA-binding SARP family transcriptional activator
VRVDIRLLGAFEVVVAGQRVPDEAWRRRQSAALVKLLALSRGHRLLREQVMDALWPESPVGQAAPRLHKAAHYARTALGVRDSVVLSDDTVSLFPLADIVVDADQFDAAADAARATGESTLAAAGVDLYRGDLLPDDLYEPWAEETRERLRLRYLDLLRALRRWDKVVVSDPADEQAHLRLAQEHMHRGDRRAALLQLDRMETVLRRELGVGPSEPAIALRDEVLAMPAEDWQPRAASRTPIPMPQTQTIGRDRDVAIVMQMLARSRVVTLLGPGGVGKTRLALEVALRWGETSSRETCFVDLTKVDEAMLVPELIVRELGIHPESATNMEQVLAEALRGQSLLVLLDNFEHVVDAAGIVGRMVRYSPDVRVVTTSRARLHFSGEQIFDVAPLSFDAEGMFATDDGLPDAVALFEQAATAVDAYFRLAPNLAEVESICRAVDGLPLAIELAAGHVRTLPPALLRARLGARLASPTAAARDLPPRQQTIPATIDWSLELLGDAERVLFARLGVFAGAVPLEAVEQVCGDRGDDVVDALSRLVDQSLVRRSIGPRGEPRFVLLELLRDRARDLLAGGEASSIADRHSAYVAALLDDLEERHWTDAADRWIDVITESLAEIRAAHAWAEQRGDAYLAARITAGLGSYWHREGHHTEGRRWVTEAMAHQADFDDCLIARLHLAAGFVERPRDQSVARRHWTESAHRFRVLGSERYLAYSLAMASASYVGDRATHDFAIRLCDEAIGLARNVGEQPLIAQALNVKGELARVHGDDALALTAYAEGRELAAAAHDEAHLGMFLGNLSFLADHRGDHEEARRLARDGLRTSWSLGRLMKSAWAISGLAGPELGLGRPERAALLVGAADRALHTLDVALDPCDLPEHKRVLTGLQAALGEATLDLLRFKGAQLPLDEAVALALSDDDETAGHWRSRVTRRSAPNTARVSGRRVDALRRGAGRRRR